MKTHMKTHKTESKIEPVTCGAPRGFGDAGRRICAALCGGSLLALGCLIPPPSAPSATPGSAASIHGGGAAAPAGAAASATPVNLKDCGPNGMIDDGEDGNNQNLP